MYLVNGVVFGTNNPSASAALKIAYLVAMLLFVLPSLRRNSSKS